eukprot:Lankesteria_metandrocarpae@DN4849_c0_g1_i3.p2
MLGFVGENEKLGVSICAVGLVLGGVGVLLFFDRALLSLANLAFVVGITFTIGPKRAINFFFKPTKLKASALYFGGAIVILWGWSMIGFFVELWGVWLLFRALLPNLVASVKLTPVGMIFNLPGIKQAGDWIYDQRRLPL